VIETPYKAPPLQPLTADGTLVANASLLWDHRHTLARVAAVACLLSAMVALVLPKQYESSTRIMPPDQSGNGPAALLAALAGKGAAGGLAGFAGSLFGVKNSGALFVALLRSGTISGALIDRFHLQAVYHKHYREDTAKKLAHKTTITDDTKSGVITIAVMDTDRQRARDLAQAYLDELNGLLARVNTSSAHRERLFIEQRLQTVQDELQRAQIELSDFSTKNTTIDIKEQTRAMVDAGAKLQGQLVASEAELESLQQIYGDENVRVRAAKVRLSILRRELERASGIDGQEMHAEDTDATHPYPALRQLPQLSVRWANLYRRVRVHETVFDLLSAQYETARIEEAKAIPTISVIDPPSWPEKKKLPHRLLIVVFSTACAVVMSALWILARRSWLALDDRDARRVLAQRIRGSVWKRWSRI
jgi:capsule polysaccharide export protein KpsE/RkpR